MENPYYEKLINAAIRFVSFRPRSEYELREFLLTKLTKWKISGKGLLDKVITRMEELGYVDDRAFASWWVDQRTSFRPKGNRAIMYELRAKGVDRTVISGVLASRDPVEAAKLAVSRKRFKNPQQLYAFLSRRGFDSETIKKVQYTL